MLIRMVLRDFRALCGKNKMTKAKISNSLDKCMAGSELRRLRDEAGLSTEGLADLMAAWGWYRSKVRRMEVLKKFGLHPLEMVSLLKALGASSL